MDDGTELGYERTYLAHERTQMAWVRTALSLISFGFTIAKFVEYMHEKSGTREPLLGSRTVGILMVIFGLVVLVLAFIQHSKAMKMLRQKCPGLPISLSSVTAGLLALIGILALLVAVLRQ